MGTWHAQYCNDSITHINYKYDFKVSMWEINV